MTSVATRRKRPEGRPTLFKSEYCAQVVDFCSQGYSLTAFAGHLRVCRDSITEWQNRYPEFASSVKKAKAARLTCLETGLFSGKNTVAYIFALKNADPEEWRDVQRTELTGKDGGPVEIDRTDRDTLMVEAKKRGLKVVTRN